jgi:hypothetical protein
VQLNTNYQRFRIASYGVNTDLLVLSTLLAIVAVITAVGLATTRLWRPDSQQLSDWCMPGQTPQFSLGFAALAQRLGSSMGEPTECEHGDPVSSNTFQKTTTGLAVYDWCTNTPTFVSGQQHWLLAPGGLVF